MLLTDGSEDCVCVVCVLALELWKDAQILEGTAPTSVSSKKKKDIFVLTTTIAQTFFCQMLIWKSPFFECENNLFFLFAWEFGRTNAHRFVDTRFGTLVGMPIPCPNPMES